jgi:hypothetical protein
MTLAAKTALRDFIHLHFIRALRHLEYLIMTTGAFEAFIDHMLFMTERDRRSTYRREPQIATPA